MFTPFLGACVGLVVGIPAGMVLLWCLQQLAIDRANTRFEARRQAAMTANYRAERDDAHVRAIAISVGEVTSAASAEAATADY